MPAVQMPVPICLNPNVLLAAIPVLVRAQLQLHINVHNCCHLRGKKKKKKPGISSDASSIRKLWDWAQK